MSYAKPEVTVLASSFEAIRGTDPSMKLGGYQDFAQGHETETNQSVIGAYESDE